MDIGYWILDHLLVLSASVLAPAFCSLLFALCSLFSESGRWSAVFNGAMALCTRKHVE